MEILEHNKREYPCFYNFCKDIKIKKGYLATGFKIKSVQKTKLLNEISKMRKIFQLEYSYIKDDKIVNRVKTPIVNINVVEEFKDKLDNFENNLKKYKRLKCNDITALLILYPKVHIFTNLFLIQREFQKLLDFYAEDFIERLNDKRCNTNKYCLKIIEDVTSNIKEIVETINELDILISKINDEEKLDYNNTVYETFSRNILDTDLHKSIVKDYYRFIKDYSIDKYKDKLKKLRNLYKKYNKELSNFFISSYSEHKSLVTVTIDKKDKSEIISLISSIQTNISETLTDNTQISDLNSTIKNIKKSIDNSFFNCKYYDLEKYSTINLVCDMWSKGGCSRINNKISEVKKLKNEKINGNEIVDYLITNYYNISLKNSEFIDCTLPLLYKLLLPKSQKNKFKKFIKQHKKEKENELQTITEKENSIYSSTIAQISELEGISKSTINNEINSDLKTLLGTESNIHDDTIKDIQNTLSKTQTINSIISILNIK